jgi:hypothetical protein
VHPLDRSRDEQRCASSGAMTDPTVLRRRALRSHVIPQDFDSGCGRSWAENPASGDLAVVRARSPCGGSSATDLHRLVLTARPLSSFACGSRRPRRGPQDTSRDLGVTRRVGGQDRGSASRCRGRRASGMACPRRQGVHRGGVRRRAYRPWTRHVLAGHAGAFGRTQEAVSSRAPIRA